VTSQITVGQAWEYFAHPTQIKASMIEPDQLPEVGFDYWASGDLCGAFHKAHWPDVWMGHFATKPTGWGNNIKHGKAILNAFWADQQPTLIIGWTPARNRAALAFTRRLGFELMGEMPLPDGKIIMQGWKSWV
jgi:hypothetical protein